MADIFLSYKREDQSKLRPLVAQLQGNGWTVWWDDEITTGQTYDLVISNQLEAARCILVVWSKLSVASPAVLTEAGFGRQRDCLIPVTIENARPPATFSGLQFIDLEPWRTTPDHPAFERLCVDIARRVGGRGASLHARRLISAIRIGYVIRTIDEGVQKPSVQSIVDANAADIQLALMDILVDLQTSNHKVVHIPLEKSPDNLLAALFAVIVQQARDYLPGHHQNISGISFTYARPRPPSVEGTHPAKLVEAIKKAVAELKPHSSNITAEGVLASKHGDSVREALTAIGYECQRGSIMRVSLPVPNASNNVVRSVLMELFGNVARLCPGVPHPTLPYELQFSSTTSRID